MNQLTRLVVAQTRRLLTGSITSTANVSLQATRAAKLRGVRRLFASEATQPRVKASGSSGPGRKSDIPWGSISIVAVTSALAGSVYVFGGRNDEVVVDANGNETRHNNYDGANPVLAYLYRFYDRITGFVKEGVESPSGPVLPPMLPPEYRRSDFTIVIDLEDTLVHSTWNIESGWRVVKRPFAEQFIEYLSNFYEVVIFSEKQVTDSIGILSKIDPNHAALYYLYHNSMVNDNGKLIKDLSLLNRDLKKVIVIDDDAMQFSRQPSNGITIKKYTGDPNDKALLELIPFLETIVRQNVPDVRDVIKAYDGLDIPSTFNSKMIKLEQDHHAQLQKRFQKK